MGMEGQSCEGGQSATCWVGIGGLPVAQPTRRRPRQRRPDFALAFPQPPQRPAIAPALVQISAGKAAQCGPVRAPCGRRCVQAPRVAASADRVSTFSAYACAQTFLRYARARALGLRSWGALGRLSGSLCGGEIGGGRAAWPPMTTTHTRVSGKQGVY